MTARPADSPPSLTEPVEDYLKAIYELEMRHGAAATSDVASALDVAPASVTGMIRRLASQGFLDHVPYKGVQLTALGRQAALRTIRRHRILETYLTRVLGYPWDRVHDEAERLEHAASDDLIARMAAALGNPTADPHGAPIPTADGHVDERTHRTLADLEVGECARMVRVSDKDPSLLRYLAEISLQPGAEITLVARAPFDGPITLRIGTDEPLVGPNLAAQVLVESMTSSMPASASARRPAAPSSQAPAATVASAGARPRSRKPSR
ncbi:metal-dependent transcriptional regulator [Gemmatimonas sp.]|uniref:metal-dependent transcriptional regulator n=1 Tax=Gemmatimonas sp. TaxID=1962908 RepID=UPI0025BC6525|nr:metal-dependent transcriptional regulator [Gemmatimonas sp.]MCA2991382.1 metal-dependent transcriptional regulator [Gemmatimonas sp.]